MRTRTSILLILGVLALCAATARAVGTVDTFWAQMGADNTLIDGGGTGHNGGEWYYYPNTLWWNQWFYDDPFDPTRWKTIDVAYDITATADGANVSICVNWTTPEWAQQGINEPPLPPLTPEEEALFVARSTPVVLYLPQQGQTEHIEEHIEILDYNPEWVSVDIWGNDFDLGCTIDHECIPEPLTLAMLAFGALALIRRRRK